MSKKIVITGGIGYIGTELCKIYSGISWNNEILVIDNRFASERVNQLRNWGIDFVHGDILNKDLVNKYCKKADIVHHLAGITDVPRVKSESDNDKDTEIKLVAEEGTQNILNVISDKCKIIFLFILLNLISFRFGISSISLINIISSSSASSNECFATSL